MNNNLTEAKIRVFVFGTLRTGERLDFYMDGTENRGMYYTEGQLMNSELGGAFICFQYKKVYTIGELFIINYPRLQTLNHLESVSGEFTSGYDLDLLPIWRYDENKKPDFDPAKKEIAFFYHRRVEPIKISSGDWLNRPKPIEEIKRFLMENENISENDITNHIMEYLNYDHLK